MTRATGTSGIVATVQSPADGYTLLPEVPILAEAGVATADATATLDLMLAGIDAIDVPMRKHHSDDMMRACAPPSTSLKMH